MINPSLILIALECYAETSMERERPNEMVRLMRAIRSLAYNRELQPLVEGRIERAESKLRGYLIRQNLTVTRIGPYEVELDGEGDILLSRLPMDDGWEQLSLPRLDSSILPQKPNYYDGREGTT
jgi:hypothetical protein